MSQRARAGYTHEQDMYLMKYLAKYRPTKEGRLGNSVYKDLVDNVDGYWPWAKHHPWQSWRERYKRNMEYFDALILKYQRKHGTQSTDSDDDELPGMKRVKRPKVVNTSQASVGSRKRPIEDSSFESRQPSIKRPRVAVGSSRAAGPSARHSVSPIEYYESTPRSADRRSKPRSDSQAGPSWASPQHETDQLSALFSPQREEEEGTPSPRANTMTNGIGDNQPPPKTPPQDKRRKTPSPTTRRPLQRRHREQSTPFTSTPPTPTVISINSTSPPDQTPTRAPPRIVNTFGRSCLVDQSGRTPKPYPESGEEDASEQNGEDRAQVPPANAIPPLHNQGRGGGPLTPHPPDVPLAATQGLTSVLSAMSAMSANHGLALDVVIAVYKRAGSLRETDRVLEGMREAAEEWAERAFRRMGDRRDSRERTGTDENDDLDPRHRQVDDNDEEDGGARLSASRGERSRRESLPNSRRFTADLDYVLAPPSARASEYSPPETTRAAKWKRRSMGGTSRSPVGVHRNENTMERSKDDIDERDRGQVEQMLGMDGKDEEGTGTDVFLRSRVESRRVSQIAVLVTPGEPPPERTHDDREECPDIRVLLRTLEPQQLEKKLGKDGVRKQIGNLFSAK
ncbi:hypothetical protein EDD15DRAFT_1198364 [Pisolithus albus]|nr:hypothetical protein EDD15DRAFT_1198364 [Pisolithus albus]